MAYKRLNLGCGPVTPDDWVNVDKISYGNNYLADIKDLPFRDNFFDFVLMNHTIHMFTFDELPIALREVRRVMKDGATLRILTPDVMSKMYDFFDPDLLSDEIEVPISKDIEPTVTGRLLRWMFWHGESRCAFTTESLISKLQESGFTDFTSGRYGDCELDSRKDECLIVEAKK